MKKYMYVINLYFVYYIVYLQHNYQFPLKVITIFSSLPSVFLSIHLY